MWNVMLFGVPSGYLTYFNIAMKKKHLFLWAMASMAMLRNQMDPDGRYL